jgi:hypothetical protein
MLCRDQLGVAIPEFVRDRLGSCPKQFQFWIQHVVGDSERSETGTDRPNEEWSGRGSVERETGDQDLIPVSGKCAD